MTKRIHLGSVTVFALVALAGGMVALAVRPTGVVATDHNEPQSINSMGADPLSPVDDTLSDSGDIYGNFAWPTASSIVLVLTFPAPVWGYDSLAYQTPPEGARPWDESRRDSYDRDVLYTFHLEHDLGGLIDRSIVNEDFAINARFGYDAERRAWGVRVEGIPGEAGAIEGQVNHELRGAGGARVQAGLFDEPFVVDLERFFMGLQVDPENLPSANLRFRRTVDFFRGQNVHGIVIEIPKEHVATRLRRIVNVWTTTHRLAGDSAIRPGNNCGPDRRATPEPAPEPTPTPAPEMPVWDCPTTWFGTHDGCDCNCGIYDPDCADPTATLYRCEPGQSCDSSGRCVNP